VTSEAGPTSLCAARPTKAASSRPRATVGAGPRDGPTAERSLVYGRWRFGVVARAAAERLGVETGPLEVLRNAGGLLLEDLPFPRRLRVLMTGDRELLDRPTPTRGPAIPPIRGPAIPPIRGPAIPPTRGGSR
jgi:hypothetical protein